MTSFTSPFIDFVHTEFCGVRSDCGILRKWYFFTFVFAGVQCNYALSVYPKQKRREVFIVLLLSVCIPCYCPSVYLVIVRLYTLLLSVCIPCYCPSVYLVIVRLYTLLLSVCIPCYCPSVYLVIVRLYTLLLSVCIPCYCPSVYLVIVRLYTLLLSVCIPCYCPSVYLVIVRLYTFSFLCCIFSVRVVYIVTRDGPGIMRKYTMLRVPCLTRMSLSKRMQKKLLFVKGCSLWPNFSKLLSMISMQKFSSL